MFLLRCSSKIYDRIKSSSFLNEICYEKLLSKSNYKISVRNICKCGTRMKKKIKIVMYKFGGNIGASRYPFFGKKEFKQKKFPSF